MSFSHISKRSEEVEKVDIGGVLSELKSERDRLSRAIAALEGIGAAAPRPKAGGTRKRGKITAAGRKRISEAMKKRWAARRRSPSKGKARASAQKKRGGLTPAGRKRLSELMKKRWAERRKKAA